MQNHTFIITVYRESPYLEECLRSLLGQSVKSKIVMATSTPSAYSQNMAAVNNIPYFVNPTNDTGAITNWNFALACADTPLVTLAHQDDIYEQTYTEELIKNTSRHSKSKVLIAFTGYTDTVNNVPRNFSLSLLVKNTLLLPFAFSKTIKNRYIKRLVLMFGNPICCPSVTFNMEVLQHFEFTHDYQCTFDWYAWYCLANTQGSFMYINKKLVRRRIHAGSGTTALSNNGQKRHDELRMFQLMWGKYLAAPLSWVYTLGYKDNKVK